MRSGFRRFCVTAIAGILGLVAAPVSAQQSSTSTEVKNFEVISVDGNKVIARTAQGSKEYTVPDDFRFTVEGKQISVHDLKPGMKGTATVTTTTTVHPVQVTEVRNGEVMQATGNSVIVRTASGIKMFSPGDIEKRGIKIVKDGKPVDLSGLHAGDKLTATIITEGTPQVMTSRQVQATLSGAPGAAPAPKATAGAAPAAAPAGGAGAGAAGAGAGAGATAGAEPKKKLPKTATQMPLVGLLGAMSLAIGFGMTSLRRRRSSH